MIDKKKVVAFVLSVVAICSLVGCGNKEDTKTEKPNNEVVSQETEKEQTDNNSIVGTWVVTKTEVYNGPLKSMVEQITNTYFYVGSEHEFTADGIYKNADGTITTNYSILDENHITMTDIGSGDATMYDYELNGDEYVQYGIYTGTASHLGHSNAVYFKRK